MYRFSNSTGTFMIVWILKGIPILYTEFMTQSTDGASINDGRNLVMGS